MVDDGHGVARGRSDLPASAEEVDLVVSIATATKMQSQVEVEEAGLRSRTQRITGLVLSLIPGLVRGEARGPANGAVLALNLVVEDDLRRVVTGYLLEGQQGEQASSCESDITTANLWSTISSGAHRRSQTTTRKSGVPDA